MDDEPDVTLEELQLLAYLKEAIADFTFKEIINQGVTDGQAGMALAMASLGTVFITLCRVCNMSREQIVSLVKEEIDAQSLAEFDVPVSTTSIN